MKFLNGSFRNFFKRLGRTLIWSLFVWLLIPFDLRAQPSSPQLQFDVRTDWSGSILHPPGSSSLPRKITVHGQTNLPAQTRLKIKVYAGVYVFRESQIELIDVARSAVRQGRWQIDFFEPAGAFYPDYYEVEVSVDPAQLTQTPDLFRKNGWRLADIRRIKKRDHLPLFFQESVRTRVQRAEALSRILSDLAGLNEELNRSINDLESIKEESPDSERIKKAFGVHKSREELLKELIKKWRQWEVGWRDRLMTLIGRFETETMFLSTQEAIRDSAAEARTLYFQYRYHIFNDDRQMPPDVSRERRFAWRVRATSSFHLGTITLRNELFYKLTKELMGRWKELMWLYHAPELKNKPSLLARVESDVNKFKNELQNQKKSKLFKLLPDQGQSESNYHRLIGILDLFRGLIKSMKSSLGQPGNEKLKDDVIKLNDLISRKVAGSLGDLE